MNPVDEPRHHTGGTAPNEGRGTKRGGVVTDELIDRLREEVGD